MEPLRIIKGDATVPQGKGNKIIAHVCNDLGGWGKGFVLAISRRWSQPEQEYRRWHRGRAANDFGLGAVQLVQVEPDIWVANMVAQRGMKTGSSGPPIRYDAVERCLQRVADHAERLGASVHMPRIGVWPCRWEVGAHRTNHRADAVRRLDRHDRVRPRLSEAAWTPEAPKKPWLRPRPAPFVCGSARTSVGDPRRRGPESAVPC